jgi:hypothetical protein
MAAQGGLPAEEEHVPDDNGATQTPKRPGAIARARAGLRAMPRWRRVLLLSGAVAIVLLVLVVLPGFVALQPAFLARYSNLAVPYRTWKTSTHKDVPCEGCHVAPTLPAQVAFDARMVGEFYLSIVRPARTLDVFAKPVNVACQRCHTSLVTKSPSGDLIIPHRAHVQVLGLQCVRCHVYLVHEASPEGKHTPTMANCLTCHNGVVAKNACVTCHTAKAAPAGHAAADWVYVHAQFVNKIDCASCHAWTPHWCADCHSRRPPSHTADWRTTHGQAVKINRDCEACHTASFCINCHGDVPQLNFNPALKLVQ